MPKISVVISTYTKERTNYVLDCIASLKEQSFQPDEIILVLDPDPELRSFYSSIIPSGVTLSSSVDRGLSNARNTGLKVANTIPNALYVTRTNQTTFTSPLIESKVTTVSTVLETVRIEVLSRNERLYLALTMFFAAAFVLALFSFTRHRRP